MFGFLKELKDAVKEGIEEAKEELALEKEAENIIANQIASLETPSIENIAIALSCPFRSALTSGSDLRLFNFNQMTDTEKEDFKKLLYRDFKIEDEDTMNVALQELDAIIEDNSMPRTIFLAAMHIYILTSSAEVGFISFEDYKELCIRYIKEITSNTTITSWKDFADQFMEGECINNVIGRQVLKSNIRLLLSEQNSPWVIFPWEKISLHS